MPRKKTTEGVYRCIGGFVTVKNGKRLAVANGTIVPYDAPYEVMNGREQLFEDLSAPRQRSSRIEQATAAPGEMRNVTKPKDDEPPKKESSKEEASPKDGDTK